MQAVLRLVPDDGLRTVEHRSVDLLAPVRRQAVQHDRVGGGLRHQLLGDRVRHERRLAQLGLGLLTHRDPGVGGHDVRAGEQLVEADRGAGVVGLELEGPVGVEAGEVDGLGHLGIALGDPLGILASPLNIVTRRGDETDYEAILEIVGKYSVEIIVVGLPISMDGTEGVQAVKTRTFADELGSRTSVPIVFQDERLTTVEARRMVQEARRTARAERYDAAAAALILQDYLNAANPAVLPDESGDFNPS